MNQIGIGVIGGGYWGKNVIRNFSDLGVLVSVAEKDPELRKHYSSTHPLVDVVPDAVSLLENERVSAVAICTPAETHGSLALASLSRGKHTFVEKPLCLDVEEAQRLDELARRRGLTLMVGHLMLYHPGFRKVSELVLGGAIGRLRYIYSHRLSLGRIRREENALWSFAPHDISMILQLTGGAPASVTAAGGQYLTPGIPDTTLCHMDFAEGVQAHIFVSWLHPYKDQRLVVIGEDAMVVLNDVERSDRKLLIYPHDIGWDGDVPVVSEAVAEPVQFDAGEPLRLECQEFLGAIRGTSTPPSDGQEGIRVLKILDACQDAIVRGERVFLSGDAHV